MPSDIGKASAALMELHDVKAGNAVLQLKLRILKIEGFAVGLRPNDLSKGAKGLVGDGCGAERTKAD